MGIGWFEACVPVAGLESEMEARSPGAMRLVLLRSKESGAAPLSLRVNHWSSFNTSCCIWLAWAREATPVCSRMEYLAMLATVDGISAAMI